MVFADLNPAWALLHACREPVIGEQLRERCRASGGRRIGKEIGIASFDGVSAVLGIRSDERSICMRCHESKRSDGHVVVGLLERIASCGGECAHLGRSATSASGQIAWPERRFLVHGDVSGVDERIEMPSHGCRGEAEVDSDGGGCGGSALEQPSGNAPGSLGDFHNASVP